MAKEKPAQLPGRTGPDHHVVLEVLLPVDHHNAFQTKKGSKTATLTMLLASLVDLCPSAAVLRLALIHGHLGLGQAARGGLRATLRAKALRELVGGRPQLSTIVGAVRHPQGEEEEEEAAVVSSLTCGQFTSAALQVTPRTLM